GAPARARPRGGARARAGGGRAALGGPRPAAAPAAHDRAVESLEWTRGLLRAAQDDPALRAVWYRVNQESEEQLVPVIAGLAGGDADPLDVRLAAAAATDAVRLALETWAATDAPAEGPGSPAALAVHCLRELTGGLRLLATPRGPGA
ncbi:TetR family transcriptional regulator, partial [Streptomyces sp. NPDC059037]